MFKEKHQVLLCSTEIITFMVKRYSMTLPLNLKVFINKTMFTTQRTLRLLIPPLVFSKMLATSKTLSPFLWFRMHATRLFRN